MTKAYFIHCSTGCSCCSNENHVRGPCSTLEIAREHAQRFHDTKLLASQYASNGRYEISEHDAEILPDGRIILDYLIFSGFSDDYPDEIPTYVPSGRFI